MKERTLTIVTVVSLLALLTLGCAVTDLLKKEAVEKIEEVAPADKEAEATAPSAKPEEAKTEAPTKASEAKPTKAPKPTATSEAEEAEGPLELASAIELDSYRQGIKMEGKHGDEPYSTDMVIEYVADPPAQRFVMKGTDEDGDDISMEMIQIGDATYMGGPDGEWMAMTSSDSPDLTEAGFMDLEDSIYSDECKYKGKEKVNGLQTKHYHCNERALMAMPTTGGGTIQDAEGDVWVSTEYNVAVKMVFSWKGKDDEGVAIEGRLEMNLTDINKPIKIEAPEGVEKPGLPDDISLMDGAHDVNAMMGMVSFIVDKPAADVAKYYQSAMPRNGWKFDESGSMGDNMLKFDKGDRSANVMLSEEGSVTNVTIMVAAE